MMQSGTFIKSLSWEGKELELPNAPRRLIVVREEVDRPQPRYDRDEQGGMAVAVGRVRECPVLDYKFVVLGPHTVRGAAGGSILSGVADGKRLSATPMSYQLSAISHQRLS